MLHDGWWLAILLSFPTGAAWMWIGVKLGIVKSAAWSDWRKPIEAFDDGSVVYMESYNGGGHPAGAWSGLSLRFVDPQGRVAIRAYTVDAAPVDNLREIRTDVA